MNMLITGAWLQAPEYICEIEKMGHSVVFLQHEKDDLPCDAQWIEGIIGNGIFIVHPIEQFTNLRFIQLTSAGFDRVPMDYVKKQGIEIYNARGVYSVPMSEYVLAGVLQLYKHMGEFRDCQKNRQWIKHRNLKELFGKNVLIVGCGNVGTECAKRFKAFDAIVIGVDIVVKSDDNYNVVKPLSVLNEALEYADIVVITVPLTDETRWLINRERLQHLKDGAVLVNIARGAIVQTEALMDELQSGRLSAVLDVFETEPLENKSILWELENVIITPHNSFVGESNGVRLNRVIMDNLKKYFRCSLKE